MKHLIIPFLVAAVAFAGGLYSAPFLRPQEEAAVADSAAVQAPPPAPDPFEDDTTGLAPDTSLAADSAAAAAAEVAGDPSRPPQVPLTQITAPLSRLDGRALTAVLSQLDADVIDRLVSQASSRERTRLLGALPSDRAARLVERLTTGQVRHPDPPQRPTNPRLRAAPTPPAPDTADVAAADPELFEQ